MKVGLLARDTRRTVWTKRKIANWPIFLLSSPTFCYYALQRLSADDYNDQHALIAKKAECT